MQNQFGIKDVISTVLMVVVICMIVLAMIQYDRQWKVLQELQNQGREQTRLLASISRTLDDMASNGVAVSRGATTQSAGVAAGGTRTLRISRRRRPCRTLRGGITWSTTCRRRSRAF